MRNSLLILSVALAGLANAAVDYPIVDTGQIRAYDDNSEIKFPKPGKKYSGQDALYASQQPSYQDNKDGTVSDLVTKLMWTQDPGEKMSYKQALKGASKCTTGGYSDWRLPTIKELYSLIKLDGVDPGPTSEDSANLKPFIDSVFKFQYGDTSNGERIIDSQFATTTEYVSTTMGGNKTMFGVNFADGRIKGYPIVSRRGTTQFHVLYVRGNTNYGKNRFEDNGDQTITDHATGLTWTKQDSSRPLNWPNALEYSENLEHAGHSDWRLPNAKELQSIIDYTRSPDTTGSAAIDPIFELTEITNEGGEKDFGQYWSSTTHVGQRSAATAVYFAFGRSLGFMQDRRSGDYELQDVHGAGSQRSDPKVGDASRYPHGRGPQGDVIRIQNMVLCVRGGDVSPVTEGPALEKKSKQSPQNRPSQNQQNNRPGFVQRLDKNKDGKVSRSEFRGPAQRFDRFDLNKDGFISQDEAPTGPPPERR